MINYPKACRERGIKCIFDPGQALPVLEAESLAAAVNDSSMLIVNDYEFEMIMNKTGLSKESLLDQAGTTIITLGEHGSKLYTEDEETEIAPVKAATVADPTGCGDAYRGGFISGLLSGKNLVESAQMGSVCASFAVECYGTQVYSFTPEEFKDRLTNGF